VPGTSEACKFYHLFPLTVKGELSRVSLWYSLSPRRGGAQRSCCSPRVQEGRGPTSTTRIRRGNLPASTPDLRVTWRPRFVMCVTSTSTLPSADLRLHCGRENSGRSRRRTGPRVRRCRSRSTIPAAYGCKQKRSRCGTRREELDERNRPARGDHVSSELWESRRPSVAECAEQRLRILCDRRAGLCAD